MFVNRKSLPQYLPRGGFSAGFCFPALEAKTKVRNCDFEAHASTWCQLPVFVINVLRLINSPAKLAKLLQNATFSWPIVSRSDVSDQVKNDYLWLLGYWTRNLFGTIFHWSLPFNLCSSSIIHANHSQNEKNQNRKSNTLWNCDDIWPHLFDKLNAWTGKLENSERPSNTPGFQHSNYFFTSCLLGLTPGENLKKLCKVTLAKQAFVLKLTCYHFQEFPSTCMPNVENRAHAVSGLLRFLVFDSPSP